MKDDLISREAAIEAANNGADDWDGGFSPSRHADIEKAINAVPSVDAVPLDKLCEWLAGNAWHLDCSDCDGEHYDCPQLYDDSGSSPAFWKAKLMKWMEEQNAAD